MRIEIKDIIHSLEFFRNINEEEVERLISISSLKNYNKDRLLYYEKSQSSQLLFLVKGLAKAYKMDKYDNEIFLYYIYSNHMISEISSLQDEHLRSYSNISFIEDSLLLSVDYMAFKRYFLDKNILCREITSEVLRQSKLLQKLVNREFVFDSVAKVAMMLSTDLNIFNRLKRYDVSLMLHIQPSTLSRVLSRLKRNNIIDIERGEVIIVDEKQLVTIYEGLEHE